MVDIFKFDVYGGPNVGVYARANDGHVFLPRGFARSKAAKLEEFLGAEALYASVANTRLLGALMVANNHGLLLPRTATDEEVAFFRSRTGLNVEVLGTKYTALGNMIGANDRGGVVSPVVEKAEAEKAADALDVEVVRLRIAGYNQAGSMMAATARGAIVHPETAEEDVRTVAEVLGAGVEPATVNGGVPFVSSGVLANGRSVVAGTFTSGPEIMMMTRAFAG